MPFNMLYYAKQFLTFFSKAAGKFNIMQFEHLLIKYSKKMNFRLKIGHATCLIQLLF